MSKNKEYKTLEAQGIYEEYKKECMLNGGTYMTVNEKLRARDLFDMIYDLHRRISWAYRIEVHYPPELYDTMLNLMGQLVPTFMLLEFQAELVAVKDGWIPWQVFILPKGYKKSDPAGCINVIDIMDPSVYEN